MVERSVAVFDTLWEAKMARTGRPKDVLLLTAAERGQLERWARRPRTEQRLALRSRIVLACAEGRDNDEVAVELGVHAKTVGKWRRRVLPRRVGGPLGEPRPHATHWSTRSVAARVGVSRSTVHRVWRAFGLKPHMVETFKISTDPLF